MVRVLFVCLGNICRSPTAHAVFANRVQAQNLQAFITLDSAGTGAWHVGEAPDARAQRHAKARGYDLSQLRARQVRPSDFHEFDYILAMDEANLRDLQALQPERAQAQLALFLSFSACRETAVPDPYYGGEQGFDHVLDLVESASDGLLAHILKTHPR